MSGAAPRARLLLLAAAAGVAVWFARRDLNPPVDRTGAGVPLGKVRRDVGAAADAKIVAGPAEPEWIRDLASWVPAPPRTLLGRALAMVWASPATLAGLLIGLLTGSAPRRRDGVLVFAPAGGLPGMVLRRQGYAATTLGHVVISRAEPSEALMRHELVHTRQAERLGPFTGPLYFWLLARFGYARHPMERAARRAGRDAKLGRLQR